MRKYLRRRHGIAATGPTGVLAVWSVEEPRRTLALPGDAGGIPGAARAAAVVQRLAGVEPRAHRVISEREAARRRMARGR